MWSICQKHSPEVFSKKAVLKKMAVFTEKHFFGGLFLIKTDSKRDSNTGVFREYCEILKNTYFEKHLRTAVFYL